MTEPTKRKLSRIVNLTTNGDDRAIAEKFLKEGGYDLEIFSFIARAEKNIP